ncbi:MAG TPA: phosphoribosylformylglycinamidine synthase subunit PurQ [Caldisericia bacterium]|nr:phosphoribosylformylglycinamidine synthase subunit PurQ [Caldisericia bacterium]HPF48635.1 phosphoribosylformylglycinamidine synthase subunit PurQ [Caldisericia bacterium]HPI83705.1 phosphoribosylformylglycinamidine synthase subunit PurQ [Caldisericia bacterium]HPQ93090.1 phosphoribosylformylglycinamidine synthase subunit PurQ [Caldisericia bacterium]HRV75077.1 phosphoribosylformylglycinamidine synthase subunit PurQ [Caldisericia bacterium]
MKVGVVVFPGSNCDTDALWTAGKVAGNQSFPIWHDSSDINGADMIIIPGGFSYGDYLRSGAIAQFSVVMDEVKRFAASGGKVIGICNGFQILTESGLLPGALLQNDTLRFESRWIEIETVTTRTPFTKNLAKGQILKVPIAHNEGRYHIDPIGLENLIKNDQIVFRYHGVNPNGSIHDIAGICNREGNVVGMMPHPERAGELITGSADGLPMFVG